MPSNQKPFDVSQMMIHLREQIRQMNDLLTTPETQERYLGFAAALYKLEGLTQYYYTVSDKDTYPLLTQQDRKLLQTSYQEAEREAILLLGEKDNGAVGRRMQQIAGELLPLMQLDHAALDITDVEREPVTLPVLIGNARAQAVDLGKQRSSVHRGNRSERQHIRVQNGRMTEEGYFTASSYVAPRKDFQYMLDELEEEFGEPYRPLLEEMRRGDLDELRQFFPTEPGANPFYREKADNAQALGAALRRAYQPLIEKGFKLSEEGREQLGNVGQRPDYIRFLDRLQRSLTPIIRQQAIFRSKESKVFHQVGEGLSIDKRNVAMSRVAGLLGVSSIIAESRPMVVYQDGRPVAGTFMRAAAGQPGQITVDIHRPDAAENAEGLTLESFNNPAALRDMASLQVLDYICGNTDRHLGNFLTHFETTANGGKRMVGLTAIDNDDSFPSDDVEKLQSRPFVSPEQMGVIGEGLYNAIRLMTKEQLRVAISDCGLSQEEIDCAWERKEKLRQKIEADRDFFRGREPGVLERDRIRVVPEADWEQYKIGRIAAGREKSVFYRVLSIPKVVPAVRQSRENKKRISDGTEANRILLGLAQPDAPAAPEEIPLGRVIGTAAVHEHDPLQAARPETLHLVVPELAKIRTVGANLSRRVPLAYMADGQEKEGFFTGRSEQLVAARMDKLFTGMIGQSPQYADVLGAVHRYFRFNDRMLGENQDVEDYVPLTADELLRPDMAAKLGLSQERAAQLRTDMDFERKWLETSAAMLGVFGQSRLYARQGIAPGQRIELRNVAMSDVGDILGVPSLLARSTTAQVMCGGTVTDGIFMEKAGGEDLANVGRGHFMAKITAEQAGKVYNDPGALRSMADMQILDFICMNNDRHERNMTYQFEGIGTENLRFKGVQGFDNDASFGTNVPEKIPEITVISTHMAAMLRDPQLSDRIAQAMRKNALGEPEIEAARKRVDILRQALDAQPDEQHPDRNRITVVQDDAWGKGAYTLENLAKKEKSLFGTVQKKVVRPMAELAAQPDARAQQMPAGEKRLTYGKAVRVGSFGMNAGEKQALALLEKKAEEEFSGEIGRIVRETQPGQAMTKADYLQKLGRDAQEMCRTLEAADPLFHGTSREYKDLKTAAGRLRDLSKTLSRRRNADGPLSEADAGLLSQALDRVSATAAVYMEKKQADADKRAAQGKQLSKVGRRRRDAALLAADRTSELRQSFEKALGRAVDAGPVIGRVRSRMQETITAARQEKGESLRERLAQAIYLGGLEDTGVDVKHSRRFADALDPAVMRTAVNRIRESAAFLSLAGRTDKALRQLTQEKDGSTLMQAYFLEKARARRLAEEKRPQPAREPAPQAEIGPRRNNK